MTQELAQSTPAGSLAPFAGEGSLSSCFDAGEESDRGEQDR